MSDADQELLSGFVEESLDSLNTIDQTFVELEKDPKNDTIINAIFRPIHTIKGASAFFNLMQIKELSHKLENLLDDMRKEKLVANQDVFDVLYDGVDTLKAMFNNTQQGQSEIDDVSQIEDLVKRVEVCQNGGEVVAPEMSDDESLKFISQEIKKVRFIVQNGKMPALDDIDKVISVMDKLEFEPPVEEDHGPETPLTALEKIIDGPFDGLEAPSDLVAHVTNTLKSFKDHLTHPLNIELYEKFIEEFNEVFNVLGLDPLLKGLLEETVQKFKQNESFTAKPEAEEGSATDSTEAQDIAEPSEVKEEKTVEKAEQSTSAKAAPAAAKKTMRIPEESIDKFLSYVGELIIVQEMFNYIQKVLQSMDNAHDISRSFTSINESFRSLSMNLQKSLMEVRKVPVSSIVQKAPRMIRDIARSTNKKIRVDIIGGDINIDKSIVETLDGPFTHMVRNAADHGIEMPEARVAAGKDEEGVITIEVTEDTEKVYLAIIDDGGGLNLDAIRSKAEKMNLIEPGAELKQETIVDLIFSSGVSTAESITDISGRGVGMDVVKRNVEETGGKITVTTTQGNGSVFKVILPKSVSTQIMEGFLVLVQEDCYVLPMDQIIESFPPSDVSQNTLSGQIETVTRRGVMYPMIRLSEVFGYTTEREKITKGIYVMIEIQRKKHVLYVDDIEGTHQVVVKAIKGVQQENDLFLGAALRGDQSIAMIVDTKKLVSTESTLEAAS